MGESRQRRLDELIEQVARGQRDLASIRDAELREAVRIALRLHKQAHDVPDAYTRLRMRARVMSGLRPRGASLRDNAWTALWLLGRPAPLIVRGVALAAFLVAAGAGATVASADTLPDDLLYPVKIAAESVRLALAGAPEDRAAVELSIAEHRLGEAEKLAASGRASDALVASAFYSQHIATAAAELAPSTASELASQLESRFAAQRDRAQTLATTLAASSKSAAAANIIAMIAKPTVAAAGSVVERVADAAVGLAAQLVEVAEADEAAAVTAANAAATTRAETSHDASPAAATPSAAAPRVNAPAIAFTQSTTTPTATRQPRETSEARSSETKTAPPEPTTSARSEEPRATERPTPSARATTEAERKASEVARAARRALEEARAAAERARSHR